jgi:hypothetical protein
MRTLFLTLVATSGAFAFIGTGSVVAAKAGKSNPSFQVTTQKTAVAPVKTIAPEGDINCAFIKLENSFDSKHVEIERPAASSLARDIPSETLDHISCFQKGR